MGKNLTFLGDLEDRNKVSIFAPSISCGWRNKMPFFKVLHTYQINRCPKFLTATKAWGFLYLGIDIQRLYRETFWPLSQTLYKAA